LAQPQVNPEVFFGLNMKFYPEQRSLEAMPQFTGGTNAGVVTLRVPRNVRVKTSMDGDESLCFCAPVVRKTRLRITVVSAKRLQNYDAGGYDLSDPYCKFEICGRPQMVWRTRVVRDNLNPVWNETFEVNECYPGDKLKFAIYDEDAVSRDDLLGKYVMSTQQFHSGQEFDGEVDLEEDGALRSKLLLRVEVLSSAARGPSKRGSIQGSASELMVIHFRTRKQPSQQRLEVQARRAHTSADLFRRACSWTVEVPAHFQDFGHPGFPQIQTDVFKKYGLDFFEAWPVGYIDLGEQCEVTVRISAPAGVQMVADVDGNRSCTFVQPGPTLDSMMEVKALVPAGAHDLNICVRPSTTDSEFEHAITYRIMRQVPATDTPFAGFPETTATFSEVRARLEEPLVARLKPGRAKFRISLSAEYSDLTLVTGGKREHLHFKQVGAKGGRRASALPHVWNDSLIVYEPEATLLALVHGEMKPLIHWIVAAS